jgi:hypothetical protein
MMRKEKKWAKNRWELMRHNPEYKKAYVEVKILCCRTDPTPDKVIKTEHTVNYPYLYTVSAQKEKELCEKFGLYSDCMINPKMSWNDLLKSTDSMEKNCFFMRTFWQHWAKTERKDKGAELLNLEHRITDLEEIENE